MVRTLCHPLPSSVGGAWALLLANRIWQRWRNWADVIKVPNQLTELTKGEIILGGPQLIRWDLSKRVQAFAEKKRLEARRTLSCWPSRSKWPSCELLWDSAPGLSSPRTEFWMIWKRTHPPDENTSPGWHLHYSLWGPEQRIQISCAQMADPQNLCSALIQ